MWSPLASHWIMMCYFLCDWIRVEPQRNPTHTSTLSLSPSLSLYPSILSLWSRAVPPDARDWAASHFVCYGIFAIGPSLPLLCPFLPPPVIVCKSGRDWATRWGWGWWLLFRWRTRRPERQPRGEIAAPSELSTAPRCWTPSPSARSWCTLTIFWDGISGFYSLRAANFSRGHLSVPTSHRKLRESRIDRRLSSLIVCWEVLPPAPTVILVWIIFLDGWHLDTKVISG